MLLININQINHVNHRIFLLNFHLSDFVLFLFCFCFLATSKLKKTKTKLKPGVLSSNFLLMNITGKALNC